MAAITYWVDPDAGNDGNDGKSYANRIQTMTQLKTNLTADGNGNDYTINCLNTADYTCNVSSSNVQVNGQTTSTFLFRGVSDSAATPAFATVKAGGTGNRYFFYISGCASFIMEYFDVDGSVSEASWANLFFQCFGSNSNAVELRYSKIRGGSAAAKTRSNIRPYPIYNLPGTIVGITRYWDMHDCLIENSTDLNVWPTSTISDDCRIFDNVFIFDLSGTTGAIMWNVIGGAVGWEFSFYGNTCYVNFGDTATLAGLIRNTEASDEIDVDFYNNVFYYDTDRLGVSSGIITGAPGSTGSFAPITAIGYNLFLKSDNITGFGIDPYDTDSPEPWDPDITGDSLSTTPSLYTGDVYDWTVAEDEVFNAPTATYDWTPTGSSVAIEIPKDLRLLTNQYIGFGDTTPGALPPVTTTYTVTCDVARVYFKEGNPITFTITVTNTGTSADSIVLTTSPMPADLNYISGNAGQGVFTYNDVSKTGSWAVGTLASGATATLTVGYIAPFGVEDDQVMTATWTSGSIGASGGSTLTETATAIPLASTGGGGAGDGGDPADNPATVPFIDTLPLKGDIHQMDVNLRLSTTRNRESEQYLRADIEERRWSEARVMRANIATNTTVDFNLGGIEQGHYLMIESDEPVLVSVNGTATADFIPQAKVVVLLDSYVESLAVKNTSTTASANVLIAVVD